MDWFSNMILNFGLKDFSNTRRKVAGEWEEHGGEIWLNEGIYEFLTNVFDGRIGKFSGIIIAEGNATIAGYNVGCTHNNLFSILLENTFSNSSYNDSKEKPYIVVFATKYSIDFVMPNELTIELFNALCEFINEIDCFERHFHAKIPYFDKAEILKLAKSKIVSINCDSEINHNL